MEETNGPMLVLSYPRAPTLRKLDTPLCDYDGTPLGLGSIHPGVYYRPGYLQNTTAAIGSLALSGSQRPSMARKASLSRVIIDEALAKSLGVSCTAPASSSQDHHPDSAHRFSEPDPFPARPPLARHRSSLYSSDALPASFAPAASAARTPHIQRPAPVPVPNPNPSDPPPARSRLQPIDPNQPSPTFVRRASEPPQHHPPEPNTRPPEPPKFMPSPSNRHMGFSTTASREVVPSHSSSSSAPSTPDPLLQVSLIALESIWPHYSADPPVLHSLLYFIKEVLRRSRTNPNTLKIGLFYLHQSRRLIRHRLALAEDSEPLDDPVLSGRKMFLASLMCASKYLQDCNFSNRAWAKISGLAVQEVNANERVFLTLIDYRLHVDVHAFDVWSIRLQKLMDEKVTGRTRAGSKSPSAQQAAYRTPEHHAIRSSSYTEGSSEAPRSTPAPTRQHTVPILSRPSAHHTPLHARALIEQHHQVTPTRQHATPVISRPTTHSSAPHYLPNTRRSSYDVPYPSSPLEHHTDTHLSSGLSGPPSRAEIFQAERELLEKIARERNHLERERHLEHRMREEDKKAQIRKLIELKQRVAGVEEEQEWSGSSGSIIGNLYADPTRRPTSSCGIEDQPQGAAGSRSKEINPRHMSARQIY